LQLPAPTPPPLPIPEPVPGRELTGFAFPPVGLIGTLTVLPADPDTTDGSSPENPKQSG